MLVEKVKETPPRAWGRPSFFSGFSSPVGNTPTCVGKTVSSASRMARNWKHPHVRGEDRDYELIQIKSGKTPPRAWGRPPDAVLRLSLAGNTPTCVGKTVPSAPRACAVGKHPHVRGEDQRKNRQCRRQVETPPRAWGRRKHPGDFLLDFGNTPTCVGKTFPATSIARTR